MEISEAADSDLPALAALMAASPLLRRYATTRESARAALARGRAAGDLLLVARGAGGGPDGLAWVIGGRTLTSAAYLRLLLVAEAARDRGIGAALLAAAEARAREQANHLVLLTTVDNARARRFYERHGYALVGALPGFAAPGIDEALYHKALRPYSERLPV